MAHPRDGTWYDDGYDHYSEEDYQEAGGVSTDPGPAEPDPAIREVTFKWDFPCLHAANVDE